MKLSELKQSETFCWNGRTWIVIDKRDSTSLCSEVRFNAYRVENAVLLFHGIKVTKNENIKPTQLG